jgi:hypothetical protein
MRQLSAVPVKFLSHSRSAKVVNNKIDKVSSWEPALLDYFDTISKEPKTHRSLGNCRAFYAPTHKFMIVMPTEANAQTTEVFQKLLPERLLRSSLSDQTDLLFRLRLGDALQLGVRKV